MTAPARTAEQRRRDAVARLEYDVVLVEGAVRALAAGGLPGDVGDAFAARTGFDPRRLTGYQFFRIQPRRILAWREADELEGGVLMRDGRWVGD